MATEHFQVNADRHLRRDRVIMPIALVENSSGRTTSIPASTLDFSPGGLRIQTSVRLSVGELIHVQFDNDSTDLRHYKVVWTKAGNVVRPGQAGLRSLKSPYRTELRLTPWPNVESGLNAA